MMRALAVCDIPAMLVIEQLTQAVPWSLDIFQDCFRQGCFSWGIECNHSLIGLIMVKRQADECHILNVCVHPEYQRQGWGRTLLEHVLLFCSKAGAKMVYLEVRQSNVRAIALYEQAEFVQIGERKDYYPLPKGREDALILA